MTFLEALSYIPRPVASPHDTDDPSNSSDLFDGEESDTPAARYWAGLAGDDYDCDDE
jgi:hypothetical protein